MRYCPPKRDVSTLEKGDFTTLCLQGNFPSFGLAGKIPIHANSAISQINKKGLSVRQIQETIRGLYHGAEISADVISNVTDALKH